MTEKETERIGIKAISTIVYDILSKEKSILQENLFEQVTDCFSNIVNSDSLENIKKRIYDVIQILEATGIILKNGKTLTFQNPDFSKRQSFRMITEKERQVLKKEEELMQRLNILTKFKAIITKNTLINRPNESITLPFILIAIKDPNATYQQSFDKRSLDINVKDIHSFLSPLNIVQKTEIDKDIVKTIWENSKYSLQIDLPSYDI